jgi:hypothetical protein
LLAVSSQLKNWLLIFDKLQIMTKQRISVPPKIREQILKEYKHRCSRCGEDSPEIHHIDENPSNNDLFNLIPLCPNCHRIWLVNPINKIESDRLKFFRIYKHPLILASQFYPLFQRLKFLENVEDTDTQNLKAFVRELVYFLQEHEKGKFYAGKILNLLSYPQYVASYDSYYGQEPPQWYIDGINNERPQYLAKLKEAKEKVYELIVEMLSYQQWSSETK